MRKIIGKKNKVHYVEETTRYKMVKSHKGWLVIGTSMFALGLGVLVTSQPVSADEAATSTSSSAVRAETTSANNSSAVNAETTSASNSSAVEAETTSASSSSAAKAETTSASSSSAVNAETTSVETRQTVTKLQTLLQQLRTNEALATDKEFLTQLQTLLQQIRTSKALATDKEVLTQLQTLQTLLQQIRTSKAETTSASSSSAVNAETTSASSSSAVNAETTSASSSSAVNADTTSGNLTAATVNSTSDTKSAVSSAATVASSSSATKADSANAASTKEYVNNSIFAIQEEPIEYAYNEEIDSIVNKWFVKLPKDYWYGWNKTEIQNGRAIISSNDGNISTIQTHNGDQTARRSPALRQNVQVEPNKKYILNIEIEKFSGDSSYLVINDEDLSAEVNGFISGPAINKPIFNYSYSKEIVSDANGIVPVSIYMQHAEDKWIYSWAPFNITITKVSITDSTEPSTEPPVITAPNQDYKVGDSIDPLKNVTASDKEDGTTKVTVAKIVDQDGKVIDSIPNDKAGKYTVTYTTTDADGNTVTKDATISVRSNDKPVITAPNQDYKVGDSIDPLKNVTASDKEDGTTKVTVAKIVDQDGKVIDSIPNDKAGKYTVTYTTTDADGNTVTKDATISVRSNDKPVITAPNQDYKVGDSIDPLKNVTASDKEDGTTKVTVAKIVDQDGKVIDSIPNDKAGKYTVTYTTTDADGNTVTKDATISVRSNDKPVITAPNQDYKVGDSIDPLKNVTASDKEDGTTKVTVAKIVDQDGKVIDSIPNDKAGKYTVTYTTTDADGNTVTKDATISVRSNDKPVITAPNQDYKVGDSIDPLKNVTASDKEDGTTKVTVAKIVDQDGKVIDSIPNDKAGKYTVTYTTTDADGNTVTKDATISVRSNDKPVITAPNQDYKVGDSIDPLKNVTASDKEDGTTKVTVAKIVDQDGKVIDSIPNDKAGKYTVTYTTTDADGNTVTKDATISVRSNDKPVITAPNQDYKVGDSIDPLKNVTASDKEDGTTKVTVAKIVDQDGKVIDSIPNDKAGKYTVTYTTTDADGNTVTKDATISVRSNDKPVITAPNQDYKVGDSIDPLKNVTASDKEDGTTKVTVAKIVDQDGKVIDSIPNDKAGKYTVTYTTTDADGNTVTKDATISVRSNDKPVITAPNQDYKVGDSIDPLKNVTASDKEDGTTKVTVAKIVDQDGKVIDSIPNDKAGKYTVTYTTTDADGNTVTKDATISVRSNDKPVITAPNQDYKVGDSIDPLKNVTASDKEDGTTKVTVAKIVDQDGKVIDSIPNDKAGKYTVTYTTTDADGNTVTKDATISVRSNDKPVITAPNQDYKVGDSIDPLKNVTASDKEDGTTKVTVAKIVDQDGKVIDSIPNDKAGKYTVTYTTTDADGNTVTKDATISVRSNDKPVITAPNQDYKVGDSIDPLKNVTASDKEDGTTKVTVAKIVDQDGKVIDSIPNDKAGKYTVTYTTTDADGNTVTKDATISVRSNDKPVITAPNQDYKVGDSIDPLKNVTASDKEDGTTKVTVAKIVDQDGKVIDSIPNDKAGKYTVTYTTTDADGNTVTKDATISVRSNDKPVITAPNQDYKVGDSIDPLKNVTASDKEDGTTKVTVAKIVDQDGKVIDSIPNDKAGKYTVTYTTTDADGNTVTKDATISVRSNDKPVITAPNQDYKVGDSIDPLKNVTASDKEDGTTKVTVAKIVDQDGKVIDSIPNDKAGKYTVTYTTTDADGNTVTKDATISVRSNDKPVITAPNQDYKVGDSIDPLKNVTASDKEDGTTKVTVAKIVDQDGKVIDSIPNDKAGKYTVTYTTTDADGNTVTKDATISVRSNDKPVITAPNQDYKVGDSIDPLKNVTASDKEDGTTKVTVAKIVDQDGKVIDSIPNDKAGKYTVTYTTTDADGNTVTKDATISVRSNDKPVITAPNQDYKVGDSIDPLKNVTASDKEDGTTKVTVAKIVDQDGKVIDSIPNDKAGKYTVTYTTTDADGNTVTKDATISVRSNDKPVITAPNQDYKVGDSIDPLKNVTASDKEDGTTKVTVAKIVDQDGKVIDSIPNDKAGKYTVTYTTTDADGNTVTKDATISVRSNDKPVITAPNQDYKVGDSIDPLKNVTASDKEDGTTKVTVAKIVDQDGKVIDSIPNDKAGKYTVTYTTTDADGNTVTKDATISVRSNEKPGNGTDNGNPSSNQPGNPSQPSNATNNGVINTSTNIGSKVNNGAVNSPELPQTGENNRQSQTMSFIGVLLAMFGSLLGFLGIKKRRND